MAAPYDSDHSPTASSDSAEEVLGQGAHERVPRLLRVGGLILLGAGAVVALMRAPAASRAQQYFLSRVSGEHFISEVAEFEKYTDTTCERDEDDIICTREEAIKKCGESCSGVHSLRCNPLYGFTLCKAGVKLKASGVSSCVFAKPGTPAPQGPPADAATRRSSTCKVAMIALLHGMCPQGISLKSTCGPSEAQVYSACEQWFGSLPNVTEEERQMRIEKCKENARFAVYKPEDVAHGVNDDDLCIECDMDACMAKPTWTWEREGIYASAAYDDVPGTPGDQHPPDGSENHCRPRVNGRVGGVHLRVRREIHEWDDATFEIFQNAVNEFRNRNDGVEDVNDYPNSWGAFTMIHQYAHGNPSPGGPFMPWHRRMLYDLETQLQMIANNCSLTLPYWNSNMEARNPLGSSIFRPERYGGQGHSTRTANGGWPCTFGRGRRGYCLVNGIASEWWLNSNSADENDCSYCVHRRPESNSLPSSATIFQEIQGITDFAVFNDRMSANHGMVHAGIIGGTMAFINSAPRDPIFYAHHAYVDRLYNYWLHYHAARGLDVNTGPETRRIMNFYQQPASEWAGRYHLGSNCVLVPSSNPQACIRYDEEPLPR